MKQHYNRIGQRLLAVILASSMLLSGCAIRRPAAQEQSTGPGYESYNETTIKTRKAFDELTNGIFIRQLSESKLNLHYLLKDPDAYQIEDIRFAFGDPTVAGIDAALSYGKAILEQLDAIDTKQLTPDQQLTAEILTSYLTTEQKMTGLELYAQPLMPTIGVQAQLPVLLCEYVFYNKQDIDDYLGLLEALPEYYGSILDFEKQKASAGLMPSDRTIDHIVESCESYLLAPGDNFMTNTFAERLDTLPELTQEEKDAYIARNNQILEESFVPAYQLLIDGMNSLKGLGSNAVGLSGYPKGKEYYDYLVYSSCGSSSKSVDQMLKAMKLRLADDLAKVGEISRNNPQVLEEADSYQFTLTDPTEILEDLKAQSKQNFPELADCKYQLKYVPKSLELSLSPAFYLTPPIDDSQDNVIYINGNERYKDNDLYTVLAHEGYPGHLYQTVYFDGKCTSNIRHIMSFGGYNEGWATYVENLSWLNDNGINPDLSTLLSSNSAAVLGIQAILDVYVNYEGWTVDQVADYLSDYYQNINDTDVAQNLYDALVEKPTNFLEYYVGYMEFQNMRDKAEKQLKDKFDPVEFHRFLLDLGPAPFDVIQKHFSAWLLTQKL